MTDNTGLPNVAIGEIINPSPNAIILEYEAEAAITKGDPVYLSSDGKVSPAVADQNCMGIAMKSVSVGGMVPVAGPGCRVKVTAGGAITRGKAVKGGDASKRVVSLADINEGGSATYSWTLKLGIAEQSCTTAGDLITILVTK